ncbi:hypothetical protein [Staphylococcus equorum]|uniref:hypothetical protein n=1 Tax=Staphylococcus equorum TaxID=246432 RepID=UPI00359454F7
MVNKIINSLSEYELKARIFPAFFTICPFLITILIWFPKLIRLESSLVISLILVVTLIFLGNLARERGKKIQKKLIQKWGSLPATLHLSHLDNTLDIETKKRYRNYLEKNIKDLKLPSQNEEIENPKNSQAKYESAIKWLLENTRDSQKFPLVHQDNITYGYSRNMLGIKPLGVTVSILSLILNVYLLYSSNYQSITEVTSSTLFSILASFIFCISWLFFVNEKWVESTSNAYARTLLSSCETPTIKSSS